MTQKKEYKPWITNISRDQLRDRQYERPGQPVTLIQIGNPNEVINPPTHPEDFAVVHGFRYYPCFREQTRSSNNLDEETAKHILKVLKEAKQSNHSVIVQCGEGRVRSATLVDVAASLLDFDYVPGTQFDPAWDDARMFSRVHGTETRYRIKSLTVTFVSAEKDHPSKKSHGVSDLMVRQLAREILQLTKLLGERECGEITGITKGAWFTEVSVLEAPDNTASVIVCYNNSDWSVPAYRLSTLLAAQMSAIDNLATITITNVKVQH